MFFYFLILCNLAFSQSRLIDRETKIAISNIIIYNTNNEVIDITNGKGIFKVKTDSIRIKDSFYGDTTIERRKKIFLTKKIQKLPVTVIKDSLPIMLRLKKALLNTEKLLPKDTVLFYKLKKTPK